MTHEVTCECGRRIAISDGMAGTDVICPCGRTMAIPAPSRLRLQEIPTPESSEQVDAHDEDQRDFWRKLTELTPRVWVTWVLIAINVAVFVVMVLSGVSAGEPSVPDLLKWGSNFGPMTANGEWWRLLTCTFVHIGFLHIALNMFVFASAGPLVERMVGNVGFLLMYLISGLIGSLASLYWNPMVVSAGASGAVFGVYGTFLCVLIRDRGSIPAKSLERLRNSGVTFVILNLLAGFFVKNIDSAGHIGGIVGGFLCGLILAQPLTHAAVPHRRVRNLLLAGLGIVLIAAGIFVARERLSELVRAQNELEHFTGVEIKAIDTVNRAAEKARRQELSDAAFADLLERDVLPDWRAARERLTTLTPPSDFIRRHLALLLEYANLRQTSWETYVTAMRTGNEQVGREAMRLNDLADAAGKRVAENLQKR